MRVASAIFFGLVATSAIAQVNGAQKISEQAAYVTSAKTIDGSGNYFADTTTASFTLTLPPGIRVGEGIAIHQVNQSWLGHALTISVPGGVKYFNPTTQTLVSATSIVANAGNWTSIEFVWSGTAWYAGVNTSTSSTSQTVFTGATAGGAGTSGAVPAPLAGQQTSALLGGAVWTSNLSITDAVASIIANKTTNGSLSLSANGTGAASLDSGGAGPVNIGTSANAKTVTIGNTTGATNIAINTGTGGINLTGPASLPSGANTSILSLTGGGGNFLWAGYTASSPYSAWLQSGYNTPNAGPYYPIALNPNGGNVGIGVINPSTTFHAAVGSKAAYINLTSNTTDPLIQLKASTTSNWTRIGSSGSTLAFVTTGNDSGSSTPTLVANSGGQVVVDYTTTTSNPAAFNVQGTGYFSDGVQFGPSTPNTIKTRFSGNYQYSVASGTGYTYLSPANPIVGNNTSGSGTAGFDAEFMDRILGHAEIDLISDARAKKDIKPIDDRAAIEKLQCLNASSYRWDDGRADKSSKLGFIAQDVGECGIAEAVTQIPGHWKTLEDGRRVFQSGVAVNPDEEDEISGFLTLDKEQINAVLWAASRGLLRRVQMLEIILAANVVITIMTALGLVRLYSKHHSTGHRKAAK